MTEQVELTGLVPADDQYNGITRSTNDFQRHYECVVCNHEGPAVDFGFIGGKPHCHTYECYEERMNDR
jgi:hypothetical protein